MMMLPTNLSLSLSFLLIAFNILLQQQQWAVVADTVQQVPCYFIFGDSLCDNGNNNNLATTSKSNYLPYGIDFPGGPTGRFCNGRIAVDIVGQHLGFNNFIPSFASATGNEILIGVNYASGAAGIRDETGYTLGARVSMNMQLKNHQTTISKIQGMLGLPAATNLLSKCLYSVNMGNNDYINNYYMPLSYPTKAKYTPDQYATTLIQQYSKQLQSLYYHGARKVAVYALDQLGCSPFALSLISQDNNVPCVVEINDAAGLFNKRLRLLIHDLNTNLSGAKFTFLNAYPSANSQLGRLKRKGGCCEIGQGGLCRPLGVTCPDRNGHLYWDGAHPTEAANEIIASIAYKAQSPEDADPYDISQLAALP